MTFFVFAARFFLTPCGWWKSKDGRAWLSEHYLTIDSSIFGNLLKILVPQIDIARVSFVHLELWDTSCWICQQELCDPGYWLGQSPKPPIEPGCESLTLEPATCNSSIGTTLIPPSETPSHHSFGNPRKSRIRIPLGFWAEPRPRWSQAHALPSRSAGCQVIEYQKHEPKRGYVGQKFSKLWPYLMFIFMFIL